MVLSNNLDEEIIMSILLVCALLFFLYLLPGITATYYTTSNNTSVLMVNIFFGWTAIGWIIAFILALKGLTGSQIVRTLVFTVAFVLVTFIMAIAEFAAVSSI